MKIIYALVLVFILTGCSIFRKHTEPTVIAPQTVNFDSEVLVPCKGLDPKVQTGTFEDIYADLVTSYVICANKQSTSIKLLKQFGNIK